MRPKEHAACLAWHWFQPDFSDGSELRRSLYGVKRRMRRALALPLFGVAFALGFNTAGAGLFVKSRLRDAMSVSTTTITSARVEPAPRDPLVAVGAKSPKNAETKLRFELTRTPLRHDASRDSGAVALRMSIYIVK